MWGMGLIYCQKNLTDGFIDAHAIHSFGVRATNKIKVADELCRVQVPGKASLWKKVSGGYQVHDYLQWNDSKIEIIKKRADAKTRIDRWRERHGRDAQSASGNAFSNAEHPPDTNGEQDAHDVVRGSGDLPGKGSGENPPPRSGGVTAGALPREHLNHAACDDTFSRCVPRAVHDKLTNLLAPKYGGDRAAASLRLHDWYPIVWQALVADFVMGDAFKFWQGHFDAAFATKDTKPTEVRSNVPSADATRKYLERQRS